MSNTIVRYKPDMGLYEWWYGPTAQEATIISKIEETQASLVAEQPSSAQVEQPSTQISPLASLVAEQPSSAQVEQSSFTSSELPTEVPKKARKVLGLDDE